MYTVYQIKNKNKKNRYIGITARTPNIRKNHHVSDSRKGSDRYLHQFIRKCAFDVDCTVLRSFKKREAAIKYEQDEINKIPKKYRLNTYKNKQ